MKFITLALLPTSALAFDLNVLLARQNAPDLTPVSQAINETTAAVTSCTTALTNLQFQAGGNTDYTPLETACVPIGEGFNSIWTSIQSSINITSPQDLLTLAPLQEPVMQMVGELQKLSQAFVAKQQGFLSAEVCPLLQKYGPQMEAWIVKTLNELSTTAEAESNYLFGKWFKNADQWAQDVPATFRGLTAQWCPAAASNTSSNGTATGINAGQNNAGGSNGTSPIVTAAAAGIVPQAGMAIMAVVGAVLVL